MVGRIIFFSVIFSLVFLLWGFDWPLKDKILTSTFCQNFHQNFNLGIHLSGKNKNVYPIADGEILFYQEEKQGYESLPNGLGSFIVLHHEGNIQSCYGHLKKGSLAKLKGSVKKDDPLGVVGDTGSTIGGNLRLMLFNTEEGEILNPVRNLIPYFSDKKGPVINSVYLRRGGDLFQLSKDTRLEAGKGEVLIDTYDQREDISRQWKLGLYQISLTYNGQEIKNIIFDSVKSLDSRQKIQGVELDYHTIYSTEGFLKLGEIDFHQGNSHLHIRVGDFSGNTTEVEIFLKVGEE